MKLGLIVTAGGTGARYGGEVGKQYIELMGVPVFIYSVKACLSALEVDQCVLTVPESDMDMVAPLLLKAGLSDIVTVVKGGSSRTASVRNGFESLENVDVVSVHDGVRPLVSTQLIQRLMDSLSNHASVIPGFCSTDTLKRVEKGVVIETLPREQIYRVQTPQLFRYDSLKRGYEWLDRNANAVVTDEAYLIEKCGESVFIVEGDKNNIKITTPDDLALVSRLIQAGTPLPQS
jgi:2-C-methyl-D-erythritol 4-phosphate cytidylyltransferase